MVQLEQAGQCFTTPAGGGRKAYDWRCGRRECAAAERDRAAGSSTCEHNGLVGCHIVPHKLQRRQLAVAVNRRANIQLCRRARNGEAELEA